MKRQMKEKKAFSSAMLVLVLDAVRSTLCYYSSRLVVLSDTDIAVLWNRLITCYGNSCRNIELPYIPPSPPLPTFKSF